MNGRAPNWSLFWFGHRFWTRPRPTRRWSRPATGTGRGDRAVPARRGLAAIALAVVVLAFGRQPDAASEAAGKDHHARRCRRGDRVVVECALGMLLTGVIVPDGETRRAGSLFHLINRMDGVKMLALAAVVARRRRSGAPRWRASWLVRECRRAAGGRDDRIGRWLPALEQRCSQAAAVSLPLLLIWVAGTGATLGRRSRCRDARAGVTHDRVIAEAAAVADEVGLERLTLAAIARRLGSRSPACTSTLTAWTRSGTTSPCSSCAS